MLTFPDHTLCAVAENDDGELVGCAGAEISEWFFSTGARVGDLFFYVSPAERDSDAAQKLMRAVIKFAREEGIAACHRTD